MNSIEPKTVWALVAGEQIMNSIERYRAEVTARGGKPKTVWALVRYGVVIDWYLSKRHAEKASHRYFDCTVQKAA